MATRAVPRAVPLAVGIAEVTRLPLNRAEALDLANLLFAHVEAALKIYGDVRYLPTLKRLCLSYVSYQCQNDKWLRDEIKPDVIHVYRLWNYMRMRYARILRLMARGRSLYDLTHQQYLTHKSFQRLRVIF